MADRTERPGRRLGRGIAVAVAVLALVPVYVAVPVGWQPAVARAIGAAAVAFGYARALRWLRLTAEPATPSTLDVAPVPEPAAVLDARVLALRDDLISSMRHRRYFDAILWPRLRQLASGDLERPGDGRRRRRRGPSFDQIERLVRQLETRA